MEGKKVKFDCRVPSIKRVAWPFFAIFILLSASCAHVEGASEPVASAKATTNQNALDDRIMDQLVPVVTMEQLYSRPAPVQGYRIRLFENGEGTYDGISHVRTLGRVEFRITPEQVRNIQEVFAKYKFWQIPENQLGRSHLSFFSIELTLRDGQKSKTVRFGGQPQAVVLRNLVDEAVGSVKWRCPYIDEHHIELCGAQDRYSSHAVPHFFGSDLPKLLETYK